MGWLGLRLARNEREMSLQRTRDLLHDRLSDVDRTINEYFDERHRELDRLAGRLNTPPETIRLIRRENPLISQVMLVHANGQLVYPDPADANESERAFLVEYADLINEIQLPENSEDGSSISSGWKAHFSGPGLNILFRKQLLTGEFVAILLSRARWMADVIAELPDTDSASDSTAASRIRLVNANGQSVYDWGHFEPEDNASPMQELALSSPLSSWRLQHYIDDAVMHSSNASYFNLLSVLAASGLVIAIGGVTFHREYHRRVTEATQRVSFVNQVSHELKTPLTNIRMYAELVATEIHDGSKARGHADVIVEESERLSRLIGNVLTLAKAQRGQLVVRPRAGQVDDAIQGVIRLFEPSFDRQDIEVKFDSGASGIVNVDIDSLEQIMGNLLSNIEKYASDGGRVHIESRFEADSTVITVSDDGPGIPKNQRDSIFKPFERLSNHIADTPGTGIGLTIARQLARQHGGDLILLDTESGASFRVTLKTPKCDGSEDI